MASLRPSSPRRPWAAGQGAVGHGPDRPNTPHIDGFWSGPPAAAASFGLPYAAYAAPAFRYRAPAFGLHRSTEQQALCYAQELARQHFLLRNASFAHPLSSRRVAEIEAGQVTPYAPPHLY